MAKKLFTGRPKVDRSKQQRNRFAPTSPTAKFVVVLSKTDRRDGSKGLAHLKRLNGKTWEQVQGSDWFESYRLKRDLACGALKITGDNNG
jgi:hypothetical protein